MNAVNMEKSKGALQMKIGNIKHGLTMPVARQVAGSDSVSVLGRLAGVTVDQVITWSKLGTLLEATKCS